MSKCHLQFFLTYYIVLFMNIPLENKTGSWKEGGEDTHVVVGKRKDTSRSCEKCRHLERGTHVPDGGIPQREEVEMVWTCAEARSR